MRGWMLALGVIVGCASPTESGESRTLIGSGDGSTGSTGLGGFPATDEGAEDSAGETGARWCVLDRGLSYSARGSTERLVDTPEGPQIWTRWVARESDLDGSLRILQFRDFDSWDVMLFEQRLFSDIALTDIEDIDGDGWPDVVAKDRDADRWQWSRGVPGPMLEPALALDELQDPTFADFSGDGVLDVVDAGRDLLVSSIGDGAGGFEPAMEIELRPPTSTTDVSVFAASPNRFLAVRGSDETAFLNLVELGPSGEVVREWTELTDLLYEEREVLAARDVNADGMQDVLVWTHTFAETRGPDGEWHWPHGARWIMPRSDGGMAVIDVATVDGASHLIDVDGDGFSDLLSEDDFSLWTVRFGDGEGFGEPESILGTVPVVDDWTAIDIDGDGWSEVLGMRRELGPDAWEPLVWSLVPCP